LWGLGLLGVVGLYLILQGRIYFLKEVTVAVLYTAGIILPSIAVTPVVLTAVHVVLIIQFVAIALLNLLIFSWFDRDKDLKDDQYSFVTKFGAERTRKLIWGFSTVLVVINIVQLTLCGGCVIAWVPFIMTAILIMIFFRSDLFSSNDAYRIVGDAIFFIPIIALI
jgi:hypothetical protein